LQDRKVRRQNSAVAVLALIITGLVAACANQATEPAPPASQLADSPVFRNDSGSFVTGVPVASAPVKPHYIVVEHGQSLRGIAHSHHVTPDALASANHLQPPYKLKAGSRLVLPNSGPPPVQQLTVSRAAPEIVALNAPQPESAAPQPPQTQALVAPVLPKAPPVLAPRNPAAALPLPGEGS
jgi:LysM repeat protein